MTDLLQLLAASRLSLAIRESPVLFPWLEVVHVVAISLVLGSILFVDLRLLGLASMDMRLSNLVVSKNSIALSFAAFSGETPTPWREPISPMVRRNSALAVGPESRPARLAASIK